MYVRSKIIKGHTYYYLVRGERHGAKVLQKVVRYLGKSAGAGQRKVTKAYLTGVLNRERAVSLVDKALTDLNDALASGKSDALTAYLNSMARFRNYSLNNQMAIALQCPHATHVAGFRERKKQGRYVRRGEKGIMITAPVIRKVSSENIQTNEMGKKPDDEVIVGFRPVYVFDVSQTEGEPLPTPKMHKAIGDPGIYTSRLKAFVESSGITLEYADFRGGLFGTSSGGRIRIRKGLPPVEEFTTLAHEVAHELLHHTPVDHGTKTVRETEAEAVAHVVSTAIGLETTQATADYISLYRGDDDTLRSSLETIRNTSNTILDGMESENNEEVE